jgi:peroxiredoxin
MPIGDVDKDIKSSRKAKDIAMPTIIAGTEAPPLSLKTADGQPFSVMTALKSQAPVVLAFFKTSCPVCQTTFPFLERLHQRFPDTPIWGISQDDAAETAEFATIYGITFPLLLDETLEWTVNYGLVSVPSLFTINKDGTIAQATFGFAKADLEELNGILAQQARISPEPLFTDADDVPTMKPG